MDKHTFVGKQKIGDSDLSDFTDYQGIGRDPLYRRYHTVENVVNRVIPEEYRSFLAIPDYEFGEDKINWYVPQWVEVPQKLSELDGEAKERYSRIKQETVAQYKKSLESLSGEDLRIMAGALRYIDDEFIYCADGKVYALAWGMTPDKTKHINSGLLVHNTPKIPIPPQISEPVEIPEPEPVVEPVEPQQPEMPLPPDPPVPPEKPSIPQDPPLPPKLPWYKRFANWVMSLGWLKWLLLALLIALIVFLILWLSTCHRQHAVEVNGVVIPDTEIDADGKVINDFGRVRPIELEDGQLPEDFSFIAPPLREEDGQLPPIERNPGVPPVISNRLILFMEDENGDLDRLAEDFKKVYPGSEYSIIGYDKEVKSLVIQIPESEREAIRDALPARLPRYRFIVFDEELYELNSLGESQSDAPPGWHLKAVRAPQGWEITKGSPNIRVAVVDDGIDPRHPMFKGRIRDAYNVYTHNNHLGSGAGHGTHVAALAVGSLDWLDKGAAGIAPDCILIPIQVVDDEMCPLSALISGIMYAIHKDADVINVSMAPSFPGLNLLPPEVQNEIGANQFKNVEKLWSRVSKIAYNKNCIIVYAAGNDDIISRVCPENRTEFAITVGAVDERLYPTDFTNYGACTDISAPGTGILSAFPGNQLKSFDGTSMAAPIVTGTVALMKTLKKDLTVEQARNVLYNTGVDVYGNMPPMVQVDLALKAVQKGDFSTPKPREIRPVPDRDWNEPGQLPPPSWTNPDSGTGSAPDLGLPDNINGKPSPEPYLPWQTEQPEGRVIGGNPDDEAPENPGSTTQDYEAIRKMIEFYRQKIKELESQLPENKG